MFNRHSKTALAAQQAELVQLRQRLAELEQGAMLRLDGQNRIAEYRGFCPGTRRRAEAMSWACPCNSG